MRKKISTLFLCCLLITSLIVSNNVMMVSAAKKATVKTTEMNIVKGKTDQIKIDNKKKGAKYTFKSSDTTKVTVDNKGVVTAVDAGTVDVVVKETIKKANKNIGTVKVTVAQAMEPIQTYLDDANFDVPNDFWDKKAGVPAGSLRTITYESTATNSTRKARVLLPAGYTTDQKYPVLYFIHGIGGDETTMYNEKVQQIFDNAMASGVAEKMIVVLPNACANETGKCPKGPDGKDLFFSLEHYKAYDNFLNDFKDCLMPYINKNFSTLTGRDNTAICGFSMGGRVSLHIGLTLPDQIRYIGGFCPAPGCLAYTNFGVTEPGLFTKTSFTLPEKYMNDTLIFIAAGTNDHTVGTFPKTYDTALTANKVPHRYYETKGGINNAGSGDHNGDVFKTGLYNFIRRIFHKQK